MKYIFSFGLLLALFAFTGGTPDAEAIIKKTDANMSADSRITESRMVIYGRRQNRTVTSVGYSEGSDKSFTEYLAPDREKGTKMLKLEDRLWIFSPSTDRTVQISGHMLRQSVMGSDLSYEDMMEDRELTEMYNAKVLGTETVGDRPVYVLELIAKVADVNYYRRVMKIDQERFVPLREDLFAKGGKLLKTVTLSDVRKTEGRWFPFKMNYKDVLKSGKGTDFIIDKIQFNPEIPEYIFSKASLKK